MAANHSISAKQAAAYPAISGTATFLSTAQANSAARYLDAHWSKAVR